MESSSEEALVGAMLMGRDFADDLDPAIFFSPRHREIAISCVWLRERGIIPNPASVEAHLEDRFAAVGGMTYCNECIDACKPWHKVLDLYETVLDAHATRLVVTELHNVAAHHDKMGADELLALAYERLAKVNVKRGSDAVEVAQVVEAACLEMHERATAAAKGDPCAYGIGTGIKALDVVLGGMGMGVVTIVAGRPSHGKSSLSRTIADNVNETGVGVHVFSMEDRRSTYGMRMISDHSGMDLGRLRRSQITTNESSSVAASVSKLRQRKRWLVDDSAGLTSSQIGLRVRRHAKANATRLVVVDYIQLIREPRFQRPIDEIGFAVKNLAAIARDEDVAMIVLSQLSREVEKRDGRKPQLSDLRESGELEQVAETVMFTVIPSKYIDQAKAPEAYDKQKGLGMVYIAKHKNSQTGECQLRWDGPTATYRDAL